MPAAVLREGLDRLRRLGARRALVMSSADNPASLRLYESVGFQRADLVTFYHRPPAAALGMMSGDSGGSVR